MAIKRRTSDSGDFSSRKRLTILRSSSCSSLNPKFIAVLFLAYRTVIPGTSTLLKVEPGPPSGIVEHGQCRTGLVRRPRRGAPLRGGTDRKQRVRPALHSH